VDLVGRLIDPDHQRPGRQDELQVPDPEPTPDIGDTSW
jgi:hypothetical protein